MDVKSFEESAAEVNEAWRQFTAELYRLRWSLGIYLGAVWLVAAGVAVWTHWL